MTANLKAFRSFPSAFAVVAASALAFTGLVASASPAHAQTSSADYRCAALVDQARAAADTVEGGRQADANRFIATGLKLCEAGNERAAAKQFRAALKIAGVDEVKDADNRMAAR
jgi:hypothetical protein